MTKAEAVLILQSRLAAAELTIDDIEIDDREYTLEDLDEIVAACYVRVSTNDQQELSPDSQILELRKAVRQHNRILPNEYIFIEEEGVSGRKVARRNAFQDMIAAAKSSNKLFRTLYLWKFSRFARNQEESIVYKSLLRKQCGVEVVSISEPLPDGPFGGLIERIIEWMDEYYSIRLASEVKRSMTLKAQRGELQSTPSFGYTVENNKLIPIPEEAAYVQEIYNRFLAGSGFTAIAKWLNSCGVVTHRGGKWENRTVEYLLRNPVYIGKLRWTPTGRLRRNYDNPETIIASAAHEPIIDQEIWDKAQQRVAEIKVRHRHYQRPEYEHRDWLSALVRCASCGASLNLNRTQHQWRCSNYIRGRCPTPQSILDERLKALVISALEHDMRSKTKLQSISLNLPPMPSPVSTLPARREKVMRSLARLREAYLAGVESLDSYKSSKLAMEAELQAIDKEMETTIPKSSASEEMAAQAKLKSAIRSALKILKDPNADVIQKHKVAHELLHRAIYDKAANTITIIYN